METKDEKDTEQHRPMNGWEALSKIVENLAFAAVLLALIGIVYVMVR